VERRWNREPGWFSTQPKQIQARLLADLHLTYETPEKAKREAKKAKTREMDRRRENYLKKHG